MNVPVIQFPGSNCDLDAVYILNKIGVNSNLIWHKDFTAHEEFDGVILPGGFSYGDHLRAGIIAAFSPGQSPPPVRTPTFLLIFIFLLNSLISAF